MLRPGTRAWPATRGCRSPRRRVFRLRRDERDLGRNRPRAAVAAERDRLPRQRRPDHSLGNEKPDLDVARRQQAHQPGGRPAPTRRREYQVSSTAPSGRGHAGLLVEPDPGLVEFPPAPLPARRAPPGSPACARGSAGRPSAAPAPRRAPPRRGRRRPSPRRALPLHEAVPEQPLGLVELLP